MRCLKGEFRLAVSTVVLVVALDPFLVDCDFLTEDFLIVWISSSISFHYCCRAKLCRHE